MNFFARLYLIVLASGVLLRPAAAQTDGSVFGSKNFLSNGLWGKIYALPDTTTRLPDFDTLKALGDVYSKEINVPVRNWTEGFPGTTDRFEWFGIEYKSLFRATKAGLYRFRLLSDDGSKLFIDEKLVIDNDGKHGVGSKDGEVSLNASEHAVRVQYFQGPRAQIALQLFVAYQSGGEEIFPGSLLTLTTPAPKTSTGASVWATVGFAVIVLLFLLFGKKRKKKKHPEP